MPDIIVTNEIPAFEEPPDITMDDTAGTQLICCGRLFCEGFTRHGACGRPLVLVSSDESSATFGCPNDGDADCPSPSDTYEVAAEPA